MPSFKTIRSSPIFTACVMLAVIVTLVLFVPSFLFWETVPRLFSGAVFNRQVIPGGALDQPSQEKNFWVMFVAFLLVMLPLILTRFLLDLKKMSSRIVFRVMSLAFFIPFFCVITIDLVSLFYYTCAGGMGGGHRDTYIPDDVRFSQLRHYFPRGLTVMRLCGFIVIFLEYVALVVMFFRLSSATPPLYHVLKREGSSLWQRCLDRTLLAWILLPVAAFLFVLVCIAIDYYFL